MVSGLPSQVPLGTDRDPPLHTCEVNKLHVMHRSLLPDLIIGADSYFLLVLCREASVGQHFQLWHLPCQLSDAGSRPQPQQPS